MEKTMTESYIILGITGIVLIGFIISVISNKIKKGKLK
jgi:hypothetical protein